MKKIFMVLAVLTLCFSLVACGNDDVVNNDNNVNTEISGENTPDVGGENEDLGGEELPGEGDGEEEFVDPNATSAAMKTLVDKLNTTAKVEVRAPFDMQITADSAMTDIGLSSEDFENKIADSVKSESMVSPSNHSLCLVEVKDGVNATELKQHIFDNCKPNKWICMSAENVLVVESGKYVMLVMSTKDNCTNLYNAFVSEFGAENVGEKLEREVIEDFGGEDWDIL